MPRILTGEIRMFAFLLLAIVGVSACSMIPGEPSALGEEDRVTATKSDGKLVVTNRTAEPIWTFIAGRQALTTMLWAPTIDGEGIAPGKAESIPIADIPKGPDEHEVVVYWWHALLQDGERVPGEAQSIVVEI